MSSRELSTEELRKLANYLPRQVNDLEVALEAMKKVTISSQETADEAGMFSRTGENANYLANGVQKIIAREMEKIKK